MLSKNQVKFIQSLQQKKNREEQGLFIAEGVKLVTELLNGDIKIKQLYGLSDYLESSANLKNTACIEVSPSELAKISGLTTPNKVLAVCEIPKKTLHYTALKEKLTLVLDDIKDPGNMGTIIRIADWFGIENIVCSEDTVEAYNPKVVQSTMGSIARVNVYYCNLNELLEQANTTAGLSVYGAMLEGENIYKMSLPESGLIVIGNESKGISDTLKKSIHHKIKIPDFSHLKNATGEAESLNAAVATAIICSEFRRGK